jgi:hypothetical protein
LGDLAVLGKIRGFLPRSAYFAGILPPGETLRVSVSRAGNKPGRPSIKDDETAPLLDLPFQIAVQAPPL